MMTIVRILLCNSIRITIFLIGTRSGENYRDPEDMWRGYDSQIIIRREITSSLYNGNGNSRSGLLGVVLPEMESKIYGGQTTCSCCGALLNLVYINNDTVKEIIEAYDNIQIHVDEQMGEGIKAEELEPIVFERFLGRRIDCETTEGKHIIGDAYSSRMDKKRGLVLVVDLGEDDEVELCQGQVKHTIAVKAYMEQRKKLVVRDDFFEILCEGIAGFLAYWTDSSIESSLYSTLQSSVVSSVGLLPNTRKKPGYEEVILTLKRRVSVL